MPDECKTKDQLIHELMETRQRVADLEFQLRKLAQAGDEKLKAVAFGSPVPQFVINRDHRILFWNKALEETTGIKAEEMVGTKRHWWAFYHEPRPCLADLLVDGDLEGIREWYGTECHKSELVTGAYEATGFLPLLGKWLHFTATVVGDSEGNILGAVETVENVTERKKSEDALRASEKRYRSLFEESRDGVYASLRDGQIIDANSAFLEIFGYSKEDLIGKNFHALYTDPAFRLTFQQEIEQKGFVKDYEIRFRKKDGMEIDCLLTSSVQLGDDGNIVGYRGILRDVTLQKLLQKQLLHAQKMESVGTLAGGIAHDFNNLLTVILGISQLLLIRKGQRDPVNAYIRKINQAAENGADLVKRILAFSRKTEIRPRPLNISHEVEQVKELLFRTIPRMIDVRLVLSNNIASVNADPIQIEQILLNLAVNAGDAMPDGGTLTIETKQVTLDGTDGSLQSGGKSGEYVMLSVSDTGSGIDPETIQHIYEPFYTTKEPGKGTGLGLAMVYGIVKQHGGNITCYSEPGNGTVFKIYFPIISEKAKSETLADESLFAEGSETILLVDDEEVVRDMGKEILELFGYTVLTACDGREALNLYKTQKDRISLVVLDLMMPEMGGKECFRNLLKENANVKVLIASGYTSGGCLKDSIDLGAKGFICKPYDIKELLGNIRQVLDCN